MRNSEGKYEATRIMKDSGTQLVGTGDTVAAARLDLKSKVQAYRESSMKGTYLVPTGEKIKSPGMVWMRNENTGHLSLKFDPHREVEVMARPDVAEYIKDGRKSNIAGKPTTPPKSQRKANENSKVSG